MKILEENCCFCGEKHETLNKDNDIELSIPIPMIVCPKIPPDKIFILRKPLGEAELIKLQDDIKNLEDRIFTRIQMDFEESLKHRRLFIDWRKL